MPKLDFTVPTRNDRTESRPVDHPETAAAIARVLTSHTKANDYQPFTRAIRAWLQDDSASRDRFIAWYEARPSSEPAAQ